jgi:hypothetical protein
MFSKKNQKEKKKYLKETLWTVLVRTLEYFLKLKIKNKIALENMKKLPSKVALNWPNFFFSIFNWPKPDKISFSVP